MGQDKPKEALMKTLLTFTGFAAVSGGTSKLVDGDTDGGPDAFVRELR